MKTVQSTSCRGERTIYRQISKLLADIGDRYPALLAQFDPEECIKLLDQDASRRPYYLMSASAQVTCLWAAVTARYGEDGFDSFQKAMMLRLIDRFEVRSVGKRYTDGVREAFAQHFARIVRSIADPAFDKYRVANDVLHKDLALCLQMVFPMGGPIVEPNSNLGLSLMLKGGVSQFVKMSKFLLEAGGPRHWYCSHLHQSALEDFTADGWNSCYQRVAEMLELNPNVRGYFSVSWYCDPALEAISPHLVYVRKERQDNGASVFYGGLDRSGQGLATSKTRRKLYDCGDYVPKKYATLWPRERMIAWARSRAFASGRESRQVADCSSQTQA